MIDKEKIRNILLIRTDRFGEFLLNIPALKALKETYSRAKLVLAVNSSVYELAKTVECVDYVVIWDEIKENLRKSGFDLCVVLNPAKEAHLKSFLAGIPVRVGYDRKWGFLLTHKLKDTKHFGDRHEVDCNLELVGLIGARTQNKEIASSGLCFPRNDRYEFLAGAIAIHPFTSDPVKQWPVERFKELALRVAQEIKARAVFVGKTEEWGQSSFGDGSCSHPPLGVVSSEIIDLVNKTSLMELAALLRRCRLLVSCDSGPVHLAAAVGTPVIALFRNDLPGKTAKRWGPSGKGHIVIEKSSLNDINVDEVLNAIKTG